MQDDLTDAVHHVVEAGWVDRDRVGIYGGSYGGYAALAGAAFTPEVYRCAVDLVGPSNLLTLLASVPEYWKPVLAQMHRRVGHPDTDRDMLWERSPLSRVQDIRRRREDLLDLVNSLNLCIVGENAVRHRRSLRVRDAASRRAHGAHPGDPGRANTGGTRPARLRRAAA